MQERLRYQPMKVNPLHCAATWHRTALPPHNDALNVVRHYLGLPPSAIVAGDIVEGDGEKRFVPERRAQQCTVHCSELIAQ